MCRDWRQFKFIIHWQGLLWLLEWSMWNLLNRLVWSLAVIVIAEKTTSSIVSKIVIFGDGVLT